jgi:hypothetical protein
MCQTDSFFINSIVIGVIGSVIASIIVVLFTASRKALERRCCKREFKKLFGTKDEKLNLILPVFKVRNDIIEFLKENKFLDAEFPLIRSNGFNANSSRLIADCDTKALKYTSDLISNILRYKPALIVDDDLSKDLNLNFIAFGGTNFYCTQVLNDEKNNFYTIREKTIINKRNNKEFTNDIKYDYGLILKFKHENFPNKIWIIIAGVDETGTSGAGWYLSNFWEKLSNRFKTNEFGIVIRVEHGVDKTAKIVDSI